MENDNTVLLNPPLFALDKDAPLHYAGNTNSNEQHGRIWDERVGKTKMLFELFHEFARTSTELATVENRSNQVLTQPN